MALEGVEDAECPFSLWLSHVAQEFNCLPSQVWQEWQRLPAGLLEEVMEARAYERAYGLYKSADTAEAQSKLPASELIEWAREFEFELAQQALDE